MDILIIEDEVKTAKALEQLILSIRPEAKVLAIIQSVAGAVRYLKANEQPDLIFMDIHLADGLSFEVFKEVKVLSPIIFCTAYDHYAIDAFKSNGIDYILKPFSRESVTAAFEKADGLHRFFQGQEDQLAGLKALISGLGKDPERDKKSFLVFKNQKYFTVATANVAFFYIKNDYPTIVTFEQEEYPVQQSLEEISQLVSAQQFFRLNRQYLINFGAIREVEHYFARKLLIHLQIPAPEPLLVGKDKVTLFLNWLENR